jgi:hypothetical protein|tara:strand:+ start:490 stop:1128 length:639 start_codon:yes stop_codon:yes gene_type:complete
MVNLFGNICADNFFDNPYQIIDISKKVKLKKTKYISGYRSENISDINKNLFDYINRKIINFIYPGAKGMDFRASTYFQKSDADENDGWVHADPTMITAVIYLTPGGTSGTSIFDAKEEFNLPRQPNKLEYFENKEKYTEKEKKLIYNNKLINNSHYIKTINYEGKFNRMIAFNSKAYHAAEVCDKERLIIISFIEYINVNVYPVTFNGLLNE